MDETVSRERAEPVRARVEIAIPTEMNEHSPFGEWECLNTFSCEVDNINIPSRESSIVPAQDVNAPSVVLGHVREHYSIRNADGLDCAGLWRR